MELSPQDLKLIKDQIGPVPDKYVKGGVSSAWISYQKRLNVMRWWYRYHQDPELQAQYRAKMSQAKRKKPS